MKRLTYIGATHTLFRGSRLVFPGEIVEMPDEEADYRLKNQGFWEEVKETPVEPVKDLKEVKAATKDKEKVLPKIGDKLVK